jgi:hypothetical protein
VKTQPVPLRLDRELTSLLREGARRTPHKQAALVRLTLRRHLRAVIDAEALPTEAPQLTNVKPWPRGVLARAYKVTACEDRLLENAGTAAQSAPSLED